MKKMTALLLILSSPLASAEPRAVSEFYKSWFSADSQDTGVFMDGLARGLLITHTRDCMDAGKAGHSLEDWTAILGKSIPYNTSDMDFQALELALVRTVAATPCAAS